MIRSFAFAALGSFFIGAVVVYNVSQGSLSFFEDNGVRLPWRRILFLSIAMLIGIFFGHLHAEVSTSKRKVRILRVLKSALNDGSLWAAFLASPVLFGIVYSAASTQPDAVLSGVFAFENGFFCQRILERRAEKILAKK